MNPAENGPAPDISVIMPALNEERNIAAAMANTLKAMDECSLKGELVVINDGSRDRTPELVREHASRDPRVRLIEHASPCGIGASFWDGVEAARGSAVVMLPGDNENDPWEIFRYYPLLTHVDIVIPFVFNKQVRSLARNALSYLYRFIINTTFLVNFNYTNGTVVYRRSLLRGLKHHSTGFFFQTDILVRAVKEGYLFAEVPYHLGARSSGVSKAVSFPSFIQVVRGYLRLVRDMRAAGPAHETGFPADSQTAARRGEKTHD
jgi:glycosyltransferase involved in cell wall biosynthesis